jgi:glycerate kinase
LRPGADLVLEVLSFDERLTGADLVVTGEGRLDRQTLSGKAPFAVARSAARRGIPCIAIAGTVECSAADLDAMGLFSAFSIVNGPMDLAQASLRAAALTEAAAERVGRLLALRYG